MESTRLNKNTLNSVAQPELPLICWFPGKSKCFSQGSGKSLKNHCLKKNYYSLKVSLRLPGSKCSVCYPASQEACYKFNETNLLQEQMFRAPRSNSCFPVQSRLLSKHSKSVSWEAKQISKIKLYTTTSVLQCVTRCCSTETVSRVIRSLSKTITLEVNWQSSCLALAIPLWAVTENSLQRRWSKSFNLNDCCIGG